jgi:hypothetical protein
MNKLVAVLLVAFTIWGMPVLCGIHPEKAGMFGVFLLGFYIVFMAIRKAGSK